MTFTSTAQFAAQAAAQRAALWPCTVTLGTDTATPPRQLQIAKAPTASTRTADDLRTGYVKRTQAVFLFPAHLFRPVATVTLALGTQLTIVADPRNPDNVGTTWRVFDLRDSDSGAERRALCFRLDS